MGDQRCPSYPRCGCVVRGTLADCNRQAVFRIGGGRAAIKRQIAPDFLEAAARTFRERNAIYGNNYQRFGELLLALFPEGGIPAVRTPDDAQRLDYIIMCLGKLQRYAHNFSKGGHRDSAHDLMVYAAMLEEFTK